jgi:hypothetical protein
MASGSSAKKPFAIEARGGRMGEIVNRYTTWCESAERLLDMLGTDFREYATRMRAWAKRPKGEPPLSPLGLEYPGTVSDTGAPVFEVTVITPSDPRFWQILTDSPDFEADLGWIVQWCTEHPEAARETADAMLASKSAAQLREDLAAAEFLAAIELVEMGRAQNAAARPAPQPNPRSKQ